MPTYEYECERCHCHFDKRQGFNEEPLSKCPRCGGEARRVFHAVPILFKGSGFYSTDHGRGWAGTAGRGKAEHEEKAKAGKSGDGAAAADTAGEGGNGSAAKKEPRGSTADKK